MFYSILSSLKLYYNAILQLSKLDTLRLAMSYIAHLQRTLEEQEELEAGEGRGVHLETKPGLRKVGSDWFIVVENRC